MDLYEIIDQVTALLPQRGRLAYQALKYQFKLDDNGVAALKAELIDVQELAVAKDGKMLMSVLRQAQHERSNAQSIDKPVRPELVEGRSLVEMV